MDPVTMTVVAGGLAAAGTAVSAMGQAKATRAQADAEQQKASIESAWAQRRAQEEQASAQRAAGDEERKAKILESRLGAVAGASGSGASDKTIQDLWGNIEKEGMYNAEMATAAGEQRASGMKYQADLNTWSAGKNASIKRSAADSTLIGGLLSAGGQAAGGYYNSRMAAKYGSGDVGLSSGGTGYGG